MVYILAFYKFSTQREKLILIIKTKEVTMKKLFQAASLIVLLTAGFYSVGSTTTNSIVNGYDTFKVEAHEMDGNNAHWKMKIQFIGFGMGENKLSFKTRMDEEDVIYSSGDFEAIGDWKGTSLGADYIVTLPDERDIASGIVCWDEAEDRSHIRPHFRLMDIRVKFAESGVLHHLADIDFKWVLGDMTYENGHTYWEFNTKVHITDNVFDAGNDTEGHKDDFGIGDSMRLWMNLDSDGTVVLNLMNLSNFPL